MIDLIDTKCFGNTISSITPPSLPENVLFENGVFNPVWVRDDFSLSNYVDVVGSKPYGDPDYMEYNVRTYYLGNMESYVDTGSCMYVRDTGSSIYQLTQDNTLIVDTTQCPGVYSDYTPIGDSNWFCIRLRDDHPVKYNNLQMVFRFLEGTKPQGYSYIQRLAYDSAYVYYNHKNMTHVGHSESEEFYSLPIDWINMGDSMINFIKNSCADYVKIATTGKCKIEIKKIFFSKIQGDILS